MSAALPPVACPSAPLGPLPGTVCPARSDETPTRSLEAGLPVCCPPVSPACRQGAAAGENAGVCVGRGHKQPAARPERAVRGGNYQNLAGPGSHTRKGPPQKPAGSSRPASPEEPGFRADRRADLRVGNVPRACLLVAVRPLLLRGRARLRRPVAPVLLALALLVAGVLRRGSLGRAWGQSRREAARRAAGGALTPSRTGRCPAPPLGVLSAARHSRRSRSPCEVTATREHACARQTATLPWGVGRTELRLGEDPGRPGKVAEDTTQPATAVKGGARALSCLPAPRTHLRDAHGRGARTAELPGRPEASGAGKVEPRGPRRGSARPEAPARGAQRGRWPWSGERGGSGFKLHGGTAGVDPGVLGPLPEPTYHELGTYLLLGPRRPDKGNSRTLRPWQLSRRRDSAPK